MGCCTEPAIVYVLQKLHFLIFQFFLQLHDLPGKKLTCTDNFFPLGWFLFYNYTAYCKKKTITSLYRQKTLHDLTIFFVHDFHFSRQFPSKRGCAKIAHPLCVLGSIEPHVCCGKRRECPRPPM